MTDQAVANTSGDAGRVSASIRNDDLCHGALTPRWFAP
jgi:hypothetical protein